MAGTTRVAALVALLGALAGCGGAQAKTAVKPKYEAPDERFVFFQVSHADLAPDGFFSVGFVAALLVEHPTYCVLVVGHADQHGKTDQNRELSFRRARVVRKVLIDNGIKEPRILVAAPRDGDESTMISLSRRADLFVFDPAQDEPMKRLGYPVEVKGE